jgi:hypothetical protein
MCVRTKTSYGCGCDYKTTVECQAIHCQGLERYQYPKKGDCRECKAQGTTLTRGRDGFGRYGQEIRRRSESRGEDEFDSVPDLSPETADVGHGISPWAAPSARERDWATSSRRKADDRWLEEHSERNFDLQSIRDALPPSHPVEDISSISRSSPRRIIISDDNLVEEPESLPRRYRCEDSHRSLPYEITSVRDDRSSELKIRHRRRQDSQESFESSPSSPSSIRKHTYTVHDYPDLYDSGYGSYGSGRSKYGGAKTEPYNYSPSHGSRVVVRTPTMPSSSRYDTGYGIGPVSIVRPAYGYSPQRY